MKQRIIMKYSALVSMYIGKSLPYYHIVLRYHITIVLPYYHYIAI